MSTPNLHPTLTGHLDAYVLGGMSLLGQELRRLRRAQGLRQVDVSKLLGHADQTTVSKWEKGVITPGEASYSKLAKVLSTTVKHLKQVQAPFDPSAPRRGFGSEEWDRATKASQFGTEGAATSEHEMWLLRCWRRMTAEQQATVAHVVDAMSTGAERPPQVGRRQRTAS